MVGNVAAVAIPVHGGKSKVDQEKFIGVLATSNQKVSWLDVPMQNAAAVHLF